MSLGRKPVTLGKMVVSQREKTAWSPEELIEVGARIVAHHLERRGTNHTVMVSRIGGQEPDIWCEPGEKAEIEWGDFRVRVRHGASKSKRGS
jgi:hypothetical protein